MSSGNAYGDDMSVNADEALQRFKERIETRPPDPPPKSVASGAGTSIAVGYDSSGGVVILRLDRPIQQLFMKAGQAEELGRRLRKMAKKANRGN